MNNEMTNIVFTRREVANLLKLSVRKIDSLIESGKLIARKFDRSVRIKKEDLQEYINNSPKV